MIRLSFGVLSHNYFLSFVYQLIFLINSYQAPIMLSELLGRRVQDEQDMAQSYRKTEYSRAQKGRSVILRPIPKLKEQKGSSQPMERVGRILTER